MNLLEVGLLLAAAVGAAEPGVVPAPAAADPGPILALPIPPRRPATNDGVTEILAIERTRRRLERRLRRDRTVMIVGGAMAVHGAVVLGIGAAILAAESRDCPQPCDNDDLLAPFMILAGSVVLGASPFVVVGGGAAYAVHKKQLRRLDAPRSAVRLRPSLRASARGVGVGLELRF